MAATTPDLQPDFELMAQASTTMAEQFTRCRNLPALDQGVAIVEAMRNMQQQMQTMQQQMQTMQQQMQTMQQQLLGMEERLGGRISANNTNTLSRLHNSQLTSPDQTLAPLSNPMTNAPIDEFPATPATLANLSMASATNLLTALGESTAGNLTAKRQRIRRAIGLKEIAV
ncbi:hypothetical protein LTR62_005071 [Meristemomyces frigidus]|uniref:Uncharacterized protein n=1 Tax=Meristemomyces frigidus TaxID=1508187 RepID=A0AAN7YSA5_9PEZI|nr:hypothetical protein LTR62_005071 [Meristemomyces frigidus]